MATPRKTRGEYRPIYEALFNGKDYRKLSADGKLVLLTLKGLCGAIGLKVWPALAEQLSERCSIPVTRARSAVSELAKTGWVEYEDGIVWVIRGLEFEPQISHGEKHQKFVQKELAGFPTCGILDRFRAHYAVFFPDTHAVVTRYPIGRAIDTPYDTTAPATNPNHQPLPQPPATSQREGRSERFAASCKLLTAAANKGISEKYGEQPSPLQWFSPGVSETLEQFEKHHVDVDFAAASVFAYARQLTLDRPPRSLKYFAQHVIDRWQAEAARSDAAAFVGAVSPQAHAESDDLRRSAIRYAREGDESWQTYCRDRGYAWEEVAA